MWFNFYIECGEFAECVEILSGTLFSLSLVGQVNDPLRGSRLHRRVGVTTNI